MKKIIYILLLFICFQANSQPKLDSLWGVWNDTTQQDTNRLISINTIVRLNYLFNQPDSAFYYLQKQYELAESSQNLKWMASARSIQGVTYHIQGNYYAAINYYNKSLSIAEKINDKKLIANTLNNIGIINKDQKNYDNALKYFNKSFKIKKEIGDKRGVANTLGNLGEIYFARGEDDIAIDYYNRGLKTIEQIGDKRIISGFLNNISTIYLKRNELNKALDYVTRSFKVRVEIHDKKGQISCLMNLSNIYRKKDDIKKSFNYSKEAFKLAKESEALVEEAEISTQLAEIYKVKGDYKKALEMQELFILLSDSVKSEKNQDEVIRQEYKYEYEKKHLTDSLSFNKEQEVKSLSFQVKLEKEQKQKYVLYGGIVFLLIIGGIVLRGYQQKKKDNQIISIQKEEVEKQKNIVDEKNQEILDSISYAKRIQSAILPQHKVIKECLKDSFIIYKPKDIVAGDFYWLEKKGGKVLFAAADCTGHGVPGAMVSVVCNNGLNRSVREHGLTDPGEILDKTREIIIQEFEKSEEDVKDGMDIALCSLEGFNLEYAGANNPLWIFRANKIIEIKADKQPIGKSDNAFPYKTNTIDLQKGDTIYIFSDGYVDQFGGEAGKKYKTKAFRDLLFSIQNNTMDNQKKIIDEAFEIWKGGLEQVDDVCVIGVRV